MMGHKIGFYREIWIIIPKLSLLPLLIWSTAEVFSIFHLSQIHVVFKARYSFYAK